MSKTGLSCLLLLRAYWKNPESELEPSYDISFGRWWQELDILIPDLTLFSKNERTKRTIILLHHHYIAPPNLTTEAAVFNPLLSTSCLPIKKKRTLVVSGRSGSLGRFRDHWFWVLQKEDRIVRGRMEFITQALRQGQIRNRRLYLGAWDTKASKLECENGI